MRRRRPVRAHFFILSLIVCCSACSPQNGGSADLEPDRPEEPQTKVTILESWQAGEREIAIEMLIKAAESEDVEALQVFNLSEEDFVRLPETERETVREAKLAKVPILRELSMHTMQLARESAGRGDKEDADRLASALRALGRANSGEHLSDLANQVGQAILRLSEQLTNPEPQ